MPTITSNQTEKYPEWNNLHQRTQYWIKEVPDSVLSNGLVKRCISYATKRMEKFPMDYSKVLNIHVSKNDSDFITVSFKGEFGAIKVEGIMIGAGGWPSLDHGISYDENDVY